MKLIKICCSVAFIMGMIAVTMFIGDRRMHAITNNNMYLIVGITLVVTSLALYTILSNKKRR
jgi:predicted tellurium resistance membrane protein TerC